MGLFMRVLIVLWVMALLLGAVFYFWDAIASIAQQYWALDKAGQDKVNDSVKLLATVLGILATVGSLLKVVLDFMSGKKSATNDSSGHTTTFQDRVEVKGDFVQGDKTVNGAKHGS